MEWKTFDQEGRPSNGEVILVWQNNLADPNCSRFQRAVYYDGREDGMSFIAIYPGGDYFKESNKWEGYDMEGDKCQLTHWMEAPAPPNFK